MYFLALLTFALLYVYEASRLSRRDYWNARLNQREADIKASQMEKLSITDPLTGLHNRMHLNKQFSSQWKRCGRSNSPLSVMLIDLDHFKLVNDTYGHIAGDECLKKVSNVLKAEIKRDTDTLARYGGEEFVVLLPDTDLLLSSQLCEILVNKIAAIEFIWENKKIHLSASIGVASMIPDVNADNQILLKSADEAMYQAKAQGRNRYCIFSKAVEDDMYKNI